MFEEMTSSEIQKIYNELWENRVLPPIMKVWNSTYKKYSNNSYMFNINGINEKSIKKSDEKIMCNGLKNIFGITNETFDISFHDACFGKGNEYKEILRLHSSSLCPLLIFHNVNQIPLELEINKEIIIFNEVFYEFQNTVFSSPSNIDVVLKGYQKESKQSVILFLESKFSEYLEPTSNIIGLPYLSESRFYNDELLNNLNLTFVKEEGNIKTQFKSNGKIKYGFKLDFLDKTNPFYIDGIKQMISHYIGAEHFFSPENKDPRLKYNGEKIYLGEILFDFKFESAINMREKYSLYYKKLAKYLNTLNKNIHVIENPFLYSMFKINNYKLTNQINNFYF